MCVLSYQSSILDTDGLQPTWLVSARVIDRKKWREMHHTQGHISADLARHMRAAAAEAE
jgi:hypothetical protein